MTSARSQRWVVFLLVFIAGVCSCSAWTYAQTSIDTAEPRDFFIEEFAVGSLSASVATITGIALAELLSSCPLGFGGIGCNSLVILLSQTIGATLGATVGVAYIGWRRGVQGNLLFAPVGGLLGVGFGIMLGTLFLSILDRGLLTYPSLPLLVLSSVGASLGTVWGYNSGATMKVKTLSFSNQRLELASITVSW
ncbi:hypothetical protein HYR54_03060 [Candidatus Acetothermia bacterium]|nr:hypothetical protein [Candidatus Acetothermia bacterium]